MADLPITFSGSMVRAILREIEKPGTGKTQTRRVFPNSDGLEEVNRTENGGWQFSYYRGLLPGRDTGRAKPPRIAVGDRLYVREHWRTEARWDAVAPRDLPETAPIYPQTEPEPGCAGRFRQAMHMPKWASRITLIVTDVRVERLQNCSEDDAIAEGIERVGNWCRLYDRPGDWPGCYDSPVRSYASLWDSINGPGAWAANPWVVAYTFKPILGHIEQVGAAA